MNIFQSIKHAAGTCRLDFVVIGGIAVIEHGHARLTTDYDLMVRRQAKTEWHNLLQELGYDLAQESDSFRQYVTREGDGWPVDLMLVNDATFEGIAAAAKTASIQGAEARVVSLNHLLALKLHVLKQGKLHRFLKDFEDVVHLVQINRMDLRSPAIRDLFLKYGTTDLYEKICQAYETR